jgi:WD40 repeat protein
MLHSCCAIVLGVSGLIPGQTVHVDPYGDPLPEGAVARVGAARLLHDNEFTWAAITPDGTRIVSGGMYGERQVHVWERSTARRLALLPTGPQNETWGVAVSPDGKRAAALLSAPGKNAFRMQVAVWDVGSGKELCRVFLRERTGFGEPILFAPDGRTVIVRVGDLFAVGVEGGKVLRRWPCRSDVLFSLAWAGHGEHVFGVGDAGFHLWNLNAAEERTVADPDGVARLRVHGDRIAVSGDGLTLAVAGRNVLRVATVTWPERDDASVQVRKVRDCTPPRQDVQLLRVSADGRQLLLAEAAGLAIAPFRSIALYDVAKGELVRERKDLMFACDAAFVGRGQVVVGRQASGYSSRLIFVVNAATGMPAAGDKTLHYLLGDAEWSAVGATIFSSGMRWDARTGKYLGVGPDVTTSPRSWKTPDGKDADVSADGKVGLVYQYAEFGDGLNRQVLIQEVQVWDVAAKKQVGRFRSSDLHRARSVWPNPETLSRDGRVWVHHWNFGIQVWDVAHGALLYETGELSVWKTGRRSEVLMRPDGRLVYVVLDGSCRLFDTDARKFIHRVEFPPLKAGLSGARITPDGRLLACGHEDGTVRVIDLHRGGVILERASGQGAVGILRFRPDQRQLLTRGPAGWGLVWDVPEVKPAFAPATASDFDELWKDLIAADGGAVRKAVERLVVTGPPAVTDLRRRLSPAPPTDFRRLVSEEVKRLASPIFREREAASARLAAMPSPVVRYLREELGRVEDLEARARLERLLNDGGPAPVPHSPEVLRQLRALEVLERIGTAEARKLLASLTAGGEGAALTEHARAALGRLP